MRNSLISQKFAQVENEIDRIMIAMKNDTATLALNGEIFIDDFSVAMDCFKRIVVELSKEVAHGNISWKLSALEVSSAIATLQAIGDPTDVESAIGAFESTGRYLQDGKELPYSQKVRKASHDLVKLINGHIDSIRFETNTFDAEVSAPMPSGEAVQFVVRRGSVRGKVQSLSNREGLRFTLYDDLDDRAVSCYLQKGMEEVMRDAWGKHAIVEGMVRRNLSTGKPSTVRQVNNVHVIEEGGPLDYMEAMGCAPAIVGSISPEEAVRRGRDDG